MLTPAISETTCQSPDGTNNDRNVTSGDWHLINYQLGWAISMIAIVILPLTILLPRPAATVENVVTETERPLGILTKNSGERAIKSQIFESLHGSRISCWGSQ